MLIVKFEVGVVHQVRAYLQLVKIVEQPLRCSEGVSPMRQDADQLLVCHPLLLLSLFD